MKQLKLILNLLALLYVLALAVGKPMTGEDDEYDDDPEYPERKVLSKNFQQESEKQQQAFYLATSTSSTTTTPKPHKAPLQKQRKKWLHAQDVHGYQVLSDGPRVYTELIKTKPMLRIRIDIPDTIRHVEKTYQRRHVELKIRNWNKVYKVHVRVPFGYEPEDLRIVEMKDHIDIIAPVFDEFLIF